MSVCVYVCVRDVWTITFELHNLSPRYFERCFILTVCRSCSKVKIIGHSSRSQEENIAKVVGTTSSESLLVKFFINRFRVHGVVSPPIFLLSPLTWLVISVTVLRCYMFSCWVIVQKKNRFPSLSSRKQNYLHARNRSMLDWFVVLTMHSTPVSRPCWVRYQHSSYNFVRKRNAKYASV